MLHNIPWWQKQDIHNVRGRNFKGEIDRRCYISQRLMYVLNQDKWFVYAFYINSLIDFRCYGIFSLDQSIIDIDIESILIAQILWTVQIDLPKFRFAKLGSNLWIIILYITFIGIYSCPDIFYKFCVPGWWNGCSSLFATRSHRGFAHADYR